MAVLLGIPRLRMMPPGKEQKSLAAGKLQDAPESNEGAMTPWMFISASGRTQATRVVAGPAGAASQPEFTRLVVVILTPLPHVSSHIVESKAVG
jgi:hypothetical protein